MAPRVTEQAFYLLGIETRHWRLRNGSVDKISCCVSIKIWVWIPSTYIKRQRWPCVPLTQGVGGKDKHIPGVHWIASPSQNTELWCTERLSHDREWQRKTPTVPEPLHAKAVTHRGICKHTAHRTHWQTHAQREEMRLLNLSRLSDGFVSWFMAMI